ncbi:MAG: class I SAM-dependent rRNA methyltransferase, partial [Oscillospiraceae bacterium]|nr:class I SAM-dependent rRNA methyltransferase [Oscillospiraceae bacterium]
MSRRQYPYVTVTEKAEKAILDGHPWVYGDEILSVNSDPADGEVADVFSKKGSWLGAGYYNSVSKIRVRIFTRNSNDKFDTAFYARKLSWAVDYRRQVMGEDFKCCRLVFGEADGLPGLTVDRFEDVLVVQITSLGLEKVKQIVVAELLAIMRRLGENISAVYERNDLALREKEGMEQGKGFLWGMGSGLTQIRENGLLYNVDYINGQKTGFFLDQKYNRAAIARVAKGRHVLDCFT